MTVRVAMVAAEVSGDRLAAGLIGAIKKRAPDTVFTGVGGPAMQAAGCELLYAMDDIGAIGLDGLLRRLPRILNIRRRLREKFTDERVNVFVGVDAPDFNLTLAGDLRQKNIPCVHYVSPTVWAWRGYRIHKIRRSVDEVLTLFPFEADYYRRHEVPVTCVGHPMADEVGEPDRDRARRALNLTGEPLIALLPGSRVGEVRRLGGVFVGAAKRILKKHPRAKFVLPFANAAAAAAFAAVTGTVTAHVMSGVVGRGRPATPDGSCRRRDESPSAPTVRIDECITATDGGARLALEACDLAVVASGTAALEAALLRRPHIVAYKLPAFSHWLVRRLRHIDYYSMPNQLLPTPMIPELMQAAATAGNIAREVDAILGDDARVATLTRHLGDLHRQLKRGANDLAAERVLTLINGDAGGVVATA